VACVRKDNHGQAAQRSYGTFPGDDTDIPVVRNLVCREVVDNQDDEVANRQQCHHARVLERIQALWKAQRYDKKDEENGYPESPIFQEWPTQVRTAKGFCNARHEITDDDHVRDANPEAFDGNGGIEHHGGIWVGDLGEREEGRRPPVEVSSAA
jgi:hypothetical protein